MTLHVGWPQAAFLVLLAINNIGDFTRMRRADAVEPTTVDGMTVGITSFLALAVITGVELWLLWCGGFFGGSS